MSVNRVSMVKCYLAAQIQVLGCIPSGSLGKMLSLGGTSSSRGSVSSGGPVSHNESSARAKSIWGGKQLGVTEGQVGRAEQKIGGETVPKKTLHCCVGESIATVLRIG